MLDVPATLASRIRVLATGRSNKNDPNDAHSIAIAALRAPALRSVEPADHGEVLRLLSKRNSDLGRQRSRVVCRLHSLFAELSPAGIKSRSTPFRMTPVELELLNLPCSHHEDSIPGGLLRSRFTCNPCVYASGTSDCCVRIARIGGSCRVHRCAHKDRPAVSLER